MEFTQDMIADCFYVAMRMNTILDSFTVFELFEKGVLSSHKELYTQDSKTLMDKASLAGLSSKAYHKLEESLNSKDKARSAMDKYLEIAERENIKILSVESEIYPYQWRNQRGMPKVYFAKGNTDLIKLAQTQGTVSVVGSRDPSKYAMYATDKFCVDFASKGIVIVSGLALGIDRIAHESAIKCGGKTIGIVAGGVDNIYPASNRDIYNEMGKNHLILSEMPPGQKIIKQYFPSRNRLISALGDVSLVMEAGEFSGTLHTASYAAAQGKDVFVLPNNIYYENAVGGMKLLGDGAEVLLDSETVIDRVCQQLIYRCEDNYVGKLDGTEKKENLEVLRHLAKENPEKLSDSDWKTLIGDILSVKPETMDDINRVIELPFYRLSTFLTEMENDGQIEYKGGKYVLTLV